ncbi:MAG: hypothetical protein PHS92_05110 [Candidatus Gracilibacteria bacterium]|nr:hypothetical protein [Candidatus Gracilibacteria bacterium]
MKKILIVGINSKIGKLFCNEYCDVFNIYGTFSSKTESCSDKRFHLDLSNLSSVDDFIEKTGDIQFDGVIYLSSLYQIDDIDNIGDMVKQINVNALNIYYLVNKLNLKHNSKNIFFTDGGTKVPKKGYFSYTLSKDILKSLVASMAIKDKDRIFVGFDLGPIITDKIGEENKNFHNKSLLRVDSPSKGLTSFMKFIIDEENFYSTGSIFDFTGGTYLFRNN